MLKLVGIIIAALPVILLVRALFVGSRQRAQAVSNFKRQVDYLVWAILCMIGAIVVFYVGKLLFDLGVIAPR
jgi:uncharacterized membrane protein